MGHHHPNNGHVGGTPCSHPQYSPDAFSLFDLAIVALDEPVATEEYGQLPALIQLDSLKPSRHTVFAAVGYGLQRINNSPNPKQTAGERVRMFAQPHLIQINRPGGIVGDSSLLLSNNHSTGGTCFGDSGGLNFIGDSNVIAGVSSFGLSGSCGRAGGVYRVDRADDLNRLATFGVTP